MQTKQIVATSFALAAVALAGATTTAIAKDNGKLKSDKFVGVPAELTGANGNFAGISGGGLPWSIGEADVTVKSSGKVDVEFEDLVFAAGPNTGRNTVPSMAVAVSCMDTAKVRTVAVSVPFAVTVASDLDPVGGDADAKTSIVLPEICLAPIVLITNATGAAWFAVDAL